MTEWHGSNIRQMVANTYTIDTFSFSYFSQGSLNETSSEYQNV